MHGSSFLVSSKVTRFISAYYDDRGCNCHYNLYDLTMGPNIDFKNGDVAKMFKYSNFEM